MNGEAQASKRFITIAGNIGVGKSTLTQLLTKTLGWEPFYEAFEDNPFLADFYADMSRWSFHSQVYFFSKKLEQHRLLLECPASVIQDRSVYEDAEIFARNLHMQGQMSDREWRVFSDLYRTLSWLLQPPNLVVYLRASVPTLFERISSRGRDYERSISEEYLAQLNALYDEWASGFTLCPVLTVETDDLNYVRYSEHLHTVAQGIEKGLRNNNSLVVP
jgi:deoxyadenosine/deoxycytidine kinase